MRILFTPASPISPLTAPAPDAYVIQNLKDEIARIRSTLEAARLENEARWNRLAAPVVPPPIALPSVQETPVRRSPKPTVKTALFDPLWRAIHKK